MATRSCYTAGTLLAMVLAMPAWAAAQTNGGQPPDNGGPQVQQPANGGVNWKGVGLGAATVVANVGYIPAKAVYAILGGITGGAGYALTGGNTDTANSIWRSSLGGDYVLTPGMLRGDTPIYFSGPTTSAQPQAPASGPPPGANQPAYPNPPNSPTSANQPEYPSSPGATSSGSAQLSGSDAGTSPRRSGGGMGRTHITTSIISEPADSGTGPVRDPNIE